MSTGRHTEPSCPFLLIFYHLYKCGGSTFNSILETNFPHSVLYAESKDHGLTDLAIGRQRRRLEVEPLFEFLADSKRYHVLSSHFASPLVASLSQQAVTILRHPFTRMQSSFNYDIMLGNIDSNVNFVEYANLRRNAMSRTLFAGASPNHPFFYGVLELFDESMVLLEHMMYVNYGVLLDLSYAAPSNVSPSLGKPSNPASQSESFEADNLADYEIYDRAVRLIESSSKDISGWNSKLSDFRRRKANRATLLQIGNLANLYPAGNSPKGCILL
jgi:hypothetical protein